MGNVAEKLKELIDRNGPKYLTDEPYKVYKELIKTKTTDKKTAGAVLLISVNGIIDNVNPDDDFEFLSKLIQQECSFNKKMADRLTEIVLELHSRENEKEWDNKDLAGLMQFKTEKISYQWKGSATWYVSNGCVDCYYDAEIEIAPTDDLVTEGELKRLLKKNPFMSKESIREYYIKELKEYLDSEFNDYVNADDYYEPVAEDFELEYCVKDWCKKNGFELLSCKGDGGDDGFEPSFRRW